MDGTPSCSHLYKSSRRSRSVLGDEPKEDIVIHSYDAQNGNQMWKGYTPYPTNKNVLRQKKLIPRSPSPPTHRNSIDSLTPPTTRDQVLQRESLK